MDLERKNSLLQGLLGPILFILFFVLLDFPIDRIIGLPINFRIPVQITTGILTGLLPGYVLYRKCLYHNKNIERIESIYDENTLEVSPKKELESLTQKMESLIKNEPELYWCGMLGSGFLVLLTTTFGTFTFLQNISRLFDGASPNFWIESLLVLLILLAIGYFGCSLAGTISEKTKHQEPIKISVKYLQKHVKNHHYDKAAKSLTFLEKENTNPLFKTIVQRALTLCQQLE